MFYYDQTMLLLIPGLLLGLWAQARVKSAYAKYSRVPSSFGGTAQDAARCILDESGNEDVRIERVPGELSDHYDPRTRTLRLSEGVISSGSLAALGIAAHEAGHAMQHHESYPWLSLRTAAVPVVNIGSNLAVPLFILGLVLSFRPLQTLGILMFALVALFALVTLPVELNASARAVRALEAGGLISGAQEQSGVRAVLNAAAMTYVAAAVSAVMQLLRLVLLSRRRDD